MGAKRGIIMRLPTLVKSAAAVLVVAGSLFAQAPSGSPVALHGQLSVKNGKIVDKNGDPYQMRGMSFFWSNPTWPGARFYTSETVNWLADDWKVDIVRAAMDPSNRGNWETVVSAAVAKGIYVIIDWHSYNAHKDLNSAKTFFSTVSNTYKNTPNVIYEIYNEPCASGAAGNSSCQGDDWAKDIKPYAQEVVNTIRNNDKNNIIAIGTPDFSKRVDQAALNPVSGDNLVYVVHYYTAEPGTQHQATLRGQCAVALSKGAALLVTEFGLSEADGGQVNKSKIDTDEANIWFDFLDENQIGWVNWSIVDKDEAASALTSGANSTGNWNDGNLTASGRFIRNKLRMYATTSYSLTLSKSGEGTVTKSPDKSSYTVGVPVTVTATPASGWKFAGFEGVVAPPTNNVSPVVVSMKSDQSMKAIFEESNIINQNATFTTGFTPWATNNSSSVVLSHDNFQLKAAVTGSGTAVGDLRVTQSGIKIEKGRKYRLSFRARGQLARSVTPRITNSTSTRDYMGNTPVSLTTTMQEFTKEFNSDTTVSNAVLRFDCGAEAVTWYLDDVKLMDIGAGTGIAAGAVAARSAAWSIAQIGGALQLRGPAEAGAMLSLYDTRGKAVRSIAAKDGLTLNAIGVPAGSYFAVVKNKAGAEVYRTRVSFVR